MKRGLLIVVLLVAGAWSSGCVLIVTNVATGQQYLCSSDLPVTDPCVPILPQGNFKPAPRP